MKLFIAATGTDVGKTYVACALLRRWRARGRPTRACKPVLSGFDPADAAGSDPALLLAAQGHIPSLQAIEAVSPWRFAAPLSPDMAAALEGRALDYPALLHHCRAALDTPGCVLIEGVGGVMVPLDATHTVLDWMQALALPVLLVTGSYLGTLSHTLTALAVLRQRGLRTLVVVNETFGSTVDLAQTAATIARHGGVRVCTMRRER